MAIANDLPDVLETTEAERLATGFIRVLELADETGQFCGKLLGDLGADVVKIEPLGGEPCRRIGPSLDDFPHPERSLSFWYYNPKLRLKPGKSGTRFRYRKPIQAFSRLRAPCKWDGDPALRSTLDPKGSFGVIGHDGKSCYSAIILGGQEYRIQKGSCGRRYRGMPGADERNQDGSIERTTEYVCTRPRSHARCSARFRFVAVARISYSYEPVGFPGRVPILAPSRRDRQNDTAGAIGTLPLPASGGIGPAPPPRGGGRQARSPRRASVEDKLAEWDRVIAFVTMKLGGVVCLGAAITDVLSPALLHLPVNDAVLFPLGFGLLVGKRALDLASRYVEIKPRMPTGC